MPPQVPWSRVHRSPPVLKVAVQGVVVKSPVTVYVKTRPLGRVAKSPFTVFAKTGPPERSMTNAATAMTKTKFLFKVLSLL
jgi:hypothetical protein